MSDDAPSRPRTDQELADELGIGLDRAMHVAALVAGGRISDVPRDMIGRTRAWRDACQHRPTIGELRLEACAELMNSTTSQVTDDSGEARACAVDVSDAYSLTVIHDLDTGDLSLDCVADWLEANADDQDTDEDEQEDEDDTDDDPGA